VLGLRAEPIVLTVAPTEQDRYFSVQLVDPRSVGAAQIMILPPIALGGA
jgi:hypothetical protein